MTKKFNCKVLAFDPRLKMKKQYVKLQENVILYKTGLSAENKPSGNDQDAAWADNTWDLKTLGTILQSTAPSNAIIDYMKIDIQEGEWSALLTAFQEMSLQNVKQLCIEIHIVGKFSNFLTHERISALKTLRGIGFRIYSSEDLGRRKVSPYTGRNVHSRFRLYFINKHFLEQVRDMKRDNSSDTLW
ncbi:uncharacterized protein LOC106166197 [Lingula anatina]|uniref:Uncharacterized protein LOC106166197 n=1 Tax=Lingula anatina TaxID=7574 RepID=A0A1S3IQD9_LINAN|nr:uncharacterized protein LOC106166197 [Lingula anatina]|eukprot:XP_013400126.1 uncharacterized protein LOC106166197 [Lingula anatina]